MATSSSAYGAYNPSAVDPFPIESTLANIVGTNNPAQAANMLDTYQVKNMVAGDNYGFDMAQQHEFAKQQLAQQLYEKNLAAVQEGAKTPGLLDIYGASPQYAQVLGGADPSVVTRVATNLRDAQRAKQF